MKEKLLPLILLCICIVTALALVTAEWSPSHATKTQKLSFSQMVSEDIEFLRLKGRIPKQWDEIQYVAYNFHSEFQQNLINGEKLNIADSPSGKNRLEIEFIDVPDQDNPSVILQMSLFELTTQNKIWELGRTYSLVPFLKKKTSETLPTGEQKNTEEKSVPSRQRASTVEDSE